MPITITLTPVELGAMKEVLIQLETCCLSHTKKKLLSKLLSFLSIMESIRGHEKLTNKYVHSYTKVVDLVTDDVMYFFNLADKGD